MKTKHLPGNLNRQAVLYIALFVCTTLLAFLFPPSADDFSWATQHGLNLFKRGFADYNGRYFGNFFAFFLTRIPLILPFIKAATLTLVLFIINRITANKSLFLSIITAVLLLIPTSLFIQGYVWTAGFSNYYLSALTIASSLYVLIFVKPDKTLHKILRILFLAVTGVAGQLYMETYTLFAVVVSVCTLIVFSKKKRRIDIAATIYSLACIAGTIIMFSNGVYKKILRKESTYQSIQTDSDSLFGTVITAIKNLFGEVSFNFVKSCAPAIILLIIVVFLLYKQNKPESKRSRMVIKVVFSLCVPPLIAFCVALAIIKDITRVWYWIGVALLIFVVAVILTLLLCAKQCAGRFVLYIMLLLLLCGPLSLVFPLGPRCYVGAYFIVIIMIHGLFAQLKFTEKPIFIKAASVALCVLFIFDIVCYAIVSVGQCRKVESAREQIARGKTTIVLESTPLHIFAYGLDTEAASVSFTQRFCRYYDLPEDIEIVYK